MRLTTITLAIALVTTTVPMVGPALADDPATEVDEDLSPLQQARTSIHHALTTADDPTTPQQGISLAKQIVDAQTSNQDRELPSGQDDTDAHRSHLDRVHATTELIHRDQPLNTPTAPAPSQSALDLAERTGDDLTEDQKDQLARLDELPEPWPAHLSAWIQAFEHLHIETVAALEDQRQEEALTGPADIVDEIREQSDSTDPASLDVPSLDDHQALTQAELDAILDARDRLLDATLALRGLNDEQPMGAEPDVQACPLIAIGLANEDTTYEQDCRLILDIGGADTYENNAGGAWTEVSEEGGCLVTGSDDRAPGFRAAALVDLGGQADTYGDTNDPRACGVNGGAATGSGFLLDDGGDDTYIAAGPSSYAHGAVNTGTATLIDLGGHDTYEGATYSNAQGFAGSGLLYDASGDDEYVSSGGFSNAAGGGGQAALVDAGGDDRYVANRASNGAGVLPGSSLLLDAEGSDVYQATNTGANGGGWLGSGLLVDLAGNDVHQATSTGTNGGGSFGGSGTLVNLGGHDIYEAGDDGANGGGSFGGQGLLVDEGGDDEYRAGSAGVNGGASLASGLLLDTRGSDAYEDRDGGSGENVTVAPKGQVGAQIDAPHPPTQPEDDSEPPAEDAPDAQPHVIVGDPDSGINPYHEVYQRPDLTEHPCTYIPDFPCDIPALNLTLDAPDLGTALREDLDVWKNITVGQWYWIPGTSIVAASCSDDGAPCLLQCSVDDIETETDPSCGSGEHGTHTSSSVLIENPDALIAFRETDGRIHAFEDRGIPVDIYTVSYSSGIPAPAPAKEACAGYQHAGVYVTSAGNTPYSTFNSCRKGDPLKISVGGAYAEDRSEEGDATKNPEVVSYYCRPTADDDSIDQYEPACGTSFSAPTVAGALSKVVLDVREHTGYTGNLDGQTLDPLYGEDGLTIADLRDAMNRTATYDPEPQYGNTDTAGSIPLNPIAPWLQWGWGFYDGLVAQDTTDHLLGEDPADPRPMPVRAYMETQNAVKTGLHGGT